MVVMVNIQVPNWGFVFGGVVDLDQIRLRFSRITPCRIKAANISICGNRHVWLADSKLHILNVMLLIGFCLWFCFSFSSSVVSQWCLKWIGYPVNTRLSITTPLK